MCYVLRLVLYAAEPLVSILTNGGNFLDRQPRLLAARRWHRALPRHRHVGRALPRAHAPTVAHLVRLELVGLRRVQEKDGDAPALVSTLSFLKCVLDF